MVASVALVIALSLQVSPPAGSSRSAPSRPAASMVDERQPVAVPPASETALAYYRSGNVLWIVDQAWGIAVLAVILLTGFSARLRNLARRIGRGWFFTIIVYFVLFLILTFVIDLPLSYYEEFVRQHAYGLSNQTFSKWFGDSLKALAVGCVAGSLFVWVPYLLLRKSPTRWWFYTAVVAIPFIVIANLVAPVWIAPLFNRFGPMHDRALEAKILALAGRADIEGARVYEVEKSVDTKTLDAYVAGLLNTKRIVLWDTIIARMDDRELLFVMGHEMGHYVLGHVWQLVILSSTLILVLLYAAYRTVGAVLVRFSSRLGFSDIADVASLPLIILLTNLFGLAVTPAALGFSRHLEHEADRFGLEITQTNHSAATAFVKLQEDALGNPWPGFLHKLWLASHPPLGERIEFANDYHPWRDGQPLKYGDYFKH
jgi:STE24 endopeptidase